MPEQRVSFRQKSEYRISKRQKWVFDQTLVKNLNEKEKLEIMTLEEIKGILDAEVLVGSECMDIEVRDAFAADLLSDVLAFAREGTLLLTGITNPQVIRTAEMLELIGIVFVRGKRPDEDAIKLAQIKKVPLLSTRYILFETCGRLFKNGLTGCIKRVEDGKKQA